MNGYYQQVIEALRKQGFSLVRKGKGSHEVWGCGNVRTTVPYNCPSRHTANEIMKQAGIKHRF
jgi:predicted RNA binding protein YcfA (HicA-like mRNA interferase family)